jgi:glycosyltransferase involved in cell wall biosynthesis
MEGKSRVRSLYNLPEKYFLYVGSIIERKNLLTICKAMHLLRHEWDLPLVIIGNGGAYKQQVKNFIQEHQLGNRCIFLSEIDAAKNSPSFQSAADFPAIYQQALAMIYPSVYEGFGIPVLEGLWSGIPVITSNVSCLPEAGGEGAFYVNPASPEDIAQQMKLIVSDPALVQARYEKTKRHLQQFTNEATAKRVMQVYSSVLEG